MKPINTVNVMKFDNARDSTSVIEMKSFPDNKEGNKEAETLFAEWVRKLDSTINDEDMDISTGDGFYEDKNSDTMIILTHST